MFEIIAEPNRRAILSLPGLGATAGWRGGCLAGSILPALARARGCSRTPPRPHGSISANEMESTLQKPTDLRRPRSGGGDVGDAEPVESRGQRGDVVYRGYT